MDNKNEKIVKSSHVKEESLYGKIYKKNVKKSKELSRKRDKFDLSVEIEVKDTNGNKKSIDVVPIIDIE